MTGHDDRHEVEDTIRAELTAGAVAGEISEHDRHDPTLIQRVQRVLHRYPALGPLVFLVAMLVAFSFMSDRFLQPFNMSLIIQQVTVVGTLAIGQTIIILTAGIDLSVGAITVFASVIMAKLSADYGVPGMAALLVGFVFGTSAGLLNGLLITRLRLPPFIVTLGTLSIFFALNLYVSASTTIRGSDMDPLLTTTAGKHGSMMLPIVDTPIPLASLGMLAMYVIMTYVLRYTAWGRHIYATGDDPEASRLTGIKVDRVLVSRLCRGWLHLRHRRLVPHGPHRRGQPAVRPGRQPRHHHGRGHRRHQPVRRAWRGHRHPDRRHHRGDGPQWIEPGGLRSAVAGLHHRRPRHRRRHGGPVDPEGERLTAVMTEAIPTPVLQAVGLNKAYGRVVALDDADSGALPG